MILVSFYFNYYSSMDVAFFTFSCKTHVLGQLIISRNSSADHPLVIVSSIMHIRKKQEATTPYTFVLLCTLGVSGLRKI